jgi:hypothetical protein
VQGRELRAISGAGKADAVARRPYTPRYRGGKKNAPLSVLENSANKQNYYRRSKQAPALRRGDEARKTTEPYSLVEVTNSDSEAEISSEV